MPDCHALIIGSGFTDFASGDALALAETRFGMPSAPLRSVLIEGRTVLTLARHGEPHTIPPHAINYRANLVALQAAGASAVIALNTVGIIGAAPAPGGIGIPDQVLDYTWGRQHTIFDGGGVALDHIDFTEPFSAKLRQLLLQAADAAGIACHDGGVYATTQGPRLETLAEVNRLERDGADYIGMTAMPEAALARELGLEYACIALVVNRAAGRGDAPIHDDVATHTVAAKRLAESLLRQYFRVRDQS